MAQLPASLRSQIPGGLNKHQREQIADLIASQRKRALAAVSRARETVVYQRGAMGASMAGGALVRGIVDGATGEPVLFEDVGGSGLDLSYSDAAALALAVAGMATGEPELAGAGLGASAPTLHRLGVAIGAMLVSSSSE